MKLKENILNSATEVLGKRTISTNGKKNNNPWFSQEVSVLAEKMKKAYALK